MLVASSSSSQSCMICTTFFLSIPWDRTSYRIMCICSIDSSLSRTYTAKSLSAITFRTQQLPTTRKTLAASSHFMSNTLTSPYCSSILLQTQMNIAPTNIPVTTKLPLSPWSRPSCIRSKLAANLTPKAPRTSAAPQTSVGLPSAPSTAPFIFHSSVLNSCHNCPNISS